ncbi:MAG: hypothetical protein HKN54_06010 [Flavobacteriaceae bacterium]|nr:hypothetical protein [Flavobacteriaceae bacterium]
MMNELKGFVFRLLVFTVLIFAVHTYLIHQFFEGRLHFPLWTIYGFNAVLVFAVYCILNYQSKKDNQKIFFSFIALTLIKMLLAVVFLLPLFYGKSDQPQLEVINFFAAYFLLLIFEIFSINKFLQKL